MNKNIKLLLGASSLAIAAIAGAALQGCSSGTSSNNPIPEAGASSFAGATSSGGAPSAGAPSAGAPSAGAPAGGAESSAGSGGSSAGAANAGAGGALAGAGGAGGSSGAAGGGGASGSGGAAATTFTLQTAGALGQVMGTAAGLTLYVFKSDTPSTTSPMSACTGACLGTWPPYYGNPVTVPSALMASDFNSFSNAGTMQSTYMGWPLYTFSGDTAPGQATGDMVNQFFAVKIPFTPPK
jgi:predicted lipoprotein with Yx(FWY)xxD motif